MRHGEMEQDAESAMRPLRLARVTRQGRPCVKLMGEASWHLTESKDMTI
jgi:hypothetical protein